MHRREQDERVGFSNTTFPFFGFLFLAIDITLGAGRGYKTYRTYMYLIIIQKFHEVNIRSQILKNTINEQAPKG
jgi:hypothetical protein